METFDNTFAQSVRKYWNLFSQFLTKKPVRHYALCMYLDQIAKIHGCNIQDMYNH